MENIFYQMQHFPQPVKGENFSKTVLIFDEQDNTFCDLGYYDFEKSEWHILGDMSFNMVCWCYIPNPAAFLKTKDFSSMKHYGYR